MAMTDLFRRNRRFGIVYLIHMSFYGNIVELSLLYKGCIVYLYIVVGELSEGYSTLLYHLSMKLFIYFAKI